MNQLVLPLLARDNPYDRCVSTKDTCSSPDKLDLDSQWLYLINKFFSHRQDLTEYKLAWSKRRQKRTLATCNIKAKRVIVAKELNNTEHAHVLEALLYHEMCHAVLGYSIKNPNGGRSAWHGREFKALECRHPDIIKLNMWIKSGGWRRAVRQDRSRYPRTKKQSSSILTFVKSFKSYLKKIKRC